jgi:hypothetical protein
MEFQPVFQPAKTGGQPTELLLGLVSKYAYQYQQRTDDAKPMTKHPARLEPVVVGVVKSFFNGSAVIGDALYQKEQERKSNNARQGADVYSMSQLGH